ncbi:MAG: heme biosynthesis HemY N-terminal domain-containing protein [Methyloceanibacter sp.]
MIRILLFILGVLAAAIGLAWLADRPGTVTVEWLGYQVETSALVGALAVAGVVVLLILIWAVLRYLFTRPAAVSAYVRERRRQQGYDALSRGLLAIGVGDRTLAQRYAGIAGRNLPREPLTALLRAQAAQLKGDRAAARRAFEAMLDRPETQLLGLRGLFLEASRSNDNEAARALAEQAVKRDPKLAWGVNALFDMQAHAGDFEGALDTLAIARRNGHVEPEAALRRRAVLLAAEARAAEASDPDKALGLASEALRLAPSLVPAAEIAGRILASKGESRQASRVISRTWKLSPHPDLALVYAYAKPGEPPRERVKRVKYLASLTPGDIEGQIAIANAAIEAHEWEEAREALAPYLDARPPARICTLMARIEAGELGDKGREREWLARALRAPRDRAWIADGYTSDRWLPVSPVTGAVDAFEWKAPVDAIGRGDDTLLIEERPEPVTQVPAALASPRTETARAERQQDMLDVSPAKTKGVPTEAPPAKPLGQEAPRSTAEQTLKPAIFVPERPPDDPGVAQVETDESPTSLERLRAAQIR